jgi:O-antigen/teichoic acid export membrane protein
VTEEELNARYKVVEKLTRLFRFERIFYLIATSLCVLMLFFAIISMFFKEKYGSVELTLMFGSSGLITMSVARLLKMWDKALNIIVSDKTQD